MTKVLLIPTTFPDVRMMSAVRKFRNRVREEGYVHPLGEGEQAFLDQQARYVLQQLGREVTESSVTSMITQIDRQLYRMMERSFTLIRPFPHLGETLSSLVESGLILSALSDFPVARKLETLGVDRYFTYRSCAQETGYLKPHKEPFSHMAKIMGLDPSEILYVGDSYRKDMVGAKRAGMKTILLTKSLRGTTEREKYSEAHPAADMAFTDYRDFHTQVTCLTT
ncbi:MAG: HAD family hydrolase [Sphaerochaetaceae bacterium]|nr:HAD family hydrolase [Sphaerochaetaceae bacterium]